VTNSWLEALPNEATQASVFVNSASAIKHQDPEHRRRHSISTCSGRHPVHPPHLSPVMVRPSLPLSQDTSRQLTQPQLPLGLLTAAQGAPMLVELKNGETLNGHLVNCDTWMNLTLKEVVQTSPEGDRFVKLAEVYVRGNNVSSFPFPSLFSLAGLRLFPFSERGSTILRHDAPERRTCLERWMKRLKRDRVLTQRPKIKYLRVPDEIIEQAKEQQQQNQGGNQRGRGQGHHRGEGRGGDRGGRGHGRGGGRGRGRGGGGGG
jgi:U6 snRNA-associated Sm-like protein LSm4